MILTLKEIDENYNKIKKQNMISIKCQKTIEIILFYSKIKRE